MGPSSGSRSGSGVRNGRPLPASVSWTRRTCELLNFGLNLARIPGSHPDITVQAPSHRGFDTRMEFLVVANEGGALYHEAPVGTMSYGPPATLDNAHNHQVPRRAA